MKKQLFKKLFFLFPLFLFILFFTLKIQAQEGKLGYIDSMRLRTEYPAFAEAQAKFDKEVTAWQAQADSIKKELDSLQTELDNQRLILSEAKRKEKEAQIESKKNEFQSFVNNIFGPDGKADRRNAELTKPILDKIITITERIANEENYAFIFDSVNGNIIYAKKSLDITDLVIEELKKSE